MAWRRWIVVAAVIVVTLKLLLLLLVLPHFEERIAPYYGIGFADDYEKLATNIAEGRGYRFFSDTAPTLLREPGYPLVLAGMFKLTGQSIETARVLNLALAIVTAYLLALLTQSLVGDRNLAGEAAALLFLVHPATLAMEARGGMEMLFTFCLVLFLFTLLRAMDRGDARHYAIAGGALGLVVLVRSTFLLFPVFLVAFALLGGAGEDRRRAVRNMMVMTAAMLLVISPWIIRNYALTQAFVPTATVQGIAAQTGLYVCEMSSSSDEDLQSLDARSARERDALAHSLRYPTKGGYFQYFYDTHHELQFSRTLLKQVIERYASAPSLLASCATRNLFGFWFAGKNWRSTLVNVVIQAPFLVLALLGVGLAWKSRNLRRYSPALLLVAYLWFTHLIVFSQARYSAPLNPVVALFGGIAAAAALRWAGKVWHKRRSAPQRPTHA